MSAEDDIHASLLGILDAYHPAKAALSRKAFVPRAVRSFLTERYRRKVAKTRNVIWGPEDATHQKWRAEFESRYPESVYRYEPPQALRDLCALRKHGLNSMAAIVPQRGVREWSGMWWASREGLVMIRRIRESDEYDSGERYILTTKGKCFAQWARWNFPAYFQSRNL